MSRCNLFHYLTFLTCEPNSSEGRKEKVMQQLLIKVRNICDAGNTRESHRMYGDRTMSLRAGLLKTDEINWQWSVRFTLHIVEVLDLNHQERYSIKLGVRLEYCDIWVTVQRNCIDNNVTSSRAQAWMVYIKWLLKFQWSWNSCFDHGGDSPVTIGFRKE